MRHLSLVIGALCGLIAHSAIVMPASSATEGRTFYVSSSQGSWGGDGSEADPWLALTQSKASSLQPGDTVRFRRGDTWAADTQPNVNLGGITVSVSGTSSLPITLTHYGPGTNDLPRFTDGVGGVCIRLDGDHLTVDGIEATDCGYAGFQSSGDHATVTGSSSSSNEAGIRIAGGSDHGVYSWNTVTDNNVLGVNTEGSDCGTPQAVNCTDDSGAFGFLINGNSNEIHSNTVSGSRALSFDFGWDGSAFEIYNGSDNSIHHNRSLDNNAFAELGIAKDPDTGAPLGTADDNEFSYNEVHADCGAECVEARGIILRGDGSQFGPQEGTLIRYNTIWLDGAQSEGIVCHAGCPASTLFRGNIVSAESKAMWADGTGWTEKYNVLDGPTNITLSPTSYQGDPAFVNAPADLRLTAASPAIERAGTSPYTYDVGDVVFGPGHAVPVPQDGNCAGGTYADAGAHEYFADC